MKEILYEEKGSVAVITFNREEKLNAMNTPIVRHLTELLVKVSEKDHIKAVILTGKGKAFVAGADIEEYSNQSLAEFSAYQIRGRKMYERIENNKKPVIAAVNGYALGGGFELVLAADLVVSSRKAKMGLPEIQLGLLPGGGGTQKLSRIIGRNRAKEYLMTGKHMTADQAYEYGIVNKVVEPEDLLTETFRIAEELSARAPYAVQEAKRLVNEGLEAPLDIAFSLDQSVLSNLYQTKDAQEGINAFIEKRKPKFKGE